MEFAGELLSFAILFFFIFELRFLVFQANFTKIGGGGSGVMSFKEAAVFGAAMGDIGGGKCKPRAGFVKGFKPPGGFAAPIGDVSMRSSDDGEEEEEKKTSQFVAGKTPGGEPEQDTSCPQWPGMLHQYQLLILVLWYVLMVVVGKVFMLLIFYRLQVIRLKKVFWIPRRN